MGKQVSFEHITFNPSRLFVLPAKNLVVKKPERDYLRAFGLLFFLPVRRGIREENTATLMNCRQPAGRGYVNFMGVFHLTYRSFRLTHWTLWAG